MIQISKKILIFAAFCCASVFVKAQEYKYKAEINAVPVNGFYRIGITPKLSAHLKTNFTDFRIFNEKGEQVQCLINNELPIFEQEKFKEFPILTSDFNDSGKSVLVIENTKGSSICEIVLFIKNASVTRYASLSGSDDKNKWFIISDNIDISKQYESKESFFINSIKFSKADYKYYKLQIENKKVDPLNILKAGSYYSETHQVVDTYIRNPPIIVSQKDSSNRKSYVKIENENAFHFDRITMYVSGQKFFERSVELYLPISDSEENKVSLNALTEFKISSKALNIFSFQKQKSKVFYLVIDNKDNPAVIVDSIFTEQYNNYIIAYLKKGSQYTIFMDDNKATKPDYDLVMFKDSIPTNIDIIGFGELKKVDKQIGKTPSTKNKYWFWVAIVATILILGFFTKKLLSEMKKNNL